MRTVRFANRAQGHTNLVKVFVESNSKLRPGQDKTFKKNKTQPL
eukprot:CAMPEP_0171564484 /NCGR_PEP_ID=MMETSP0960-20121227/16313_1 /TAXON_ID=87120 /ORGANISM="Aurantiochytrium limacinum, Strain ATCCMYA-1381" /LENGTH=43 /DNA_ID= /DNA_START= /DNA_END= /DNA_ORIENTATION=